MLSQQILDSAAPGIVCLDLDGRILYANPAAARLFGSSSTDELSGQPICSYLQFLGESSGQEVCCRDDGTTVAVEYQRTTIREHERVVASVLTLRDVTEQQRAERSNAELLGIVSHELRTPLTAIRSSLGLLAGGALGRLPQGGQRMLEIAVNNTDRLIRLVNEVLDLERLTAGYGLSDPAPVRIAEIMREAVDGVQPLADQAGVRIELLAGDGCVFGNHDRLVQVLTNLLANAIKFSPADGGTVWLDAERLSGEVVLRVRDEGRGIPAEQLETIFERFAQVDAGDARKRGGTGLGLAISRAIVLEHGGQIWAESSPGSGTTLCVALPWADATAVMAPADDAVPASGAAWAPTGPALNAADERAA